MTICAQTDMNPKTQTDPYRSIARLITTSQPLGQGRYQSAPRLLQISEYRLTRLIGFILGK